MNRDIADKTRQLLETIAEAAAHPDYMENMELRRLAADGRAKVTRVLETELSCSLDERIGASRCADAEWLPIAAGLLEQLCDPFRPRNIYDVQFQNLLEHIWSHSERELLDDLIRQLAAMGEQMKPTRDYFVQYFARFPLWGTLDPEHGDYDTFARRAAVLKRHSYDFLWLYRRLGDYLSRRTLTAILLNWTNLDMAYLQEIRSIFTDYWEPDLFPDNAGDVLVDVGAFVGDSIQQYVHAYGTGYRKIYAYEISEDSYRQLCENVEQMGLHDVVTKRKGAGAAYGEMFVGESGEASSANRLSRSAGGAGTAGRVEVVPLDEDLDDIPTFLKMDIEGAEQDALRGCARTIREHRPKLAICTYHGYEDIWKIPRMIDGMAPGYKFYLRHYGGNIIPTEFVLLCKP